MRNPELAAFFDLPWVQAGMNYPQWRAWVKFLHDEPLAMEDWQQINSTKIPYLEIEDNIAQWFGSLAIKGLTERITRRDAPSAPAIGQGTVRR
jgi:hypothetical protein